MGKGRGSSSSDTMTTTTNVTMHHGYGGYGGSSQFGSSYGGYGSAYGGSMMGGMQPGSVYGAGMPPGSVYGAGGLQPGSVYGAGAPPGSVYGGGGFGPGSVYGGAGSMYGGAPTVTLQAPGNPYGNRTALDSVAMSIGGGPTSMSVAGPPATGYGPALSVTSVGGGNQPVVTVPALGPSPLPGGAGRAGAGMNSGVGIGSTSNFNSSANSNQNLVPGGTGFNNANSSNNFGNNNNNNGNNNLGNQGNNVGVATLNTNTSATTTRVGSPATSAANVGTSSGKGRIFGQALVLDNGGGLCKIGFAGEQYPRSVFPSLVGRPKHSGVMSSDKLYVGSEAQIKRGILALSHPIEHGVIKDWNYQELVWNCAWRDELKVKPEDYPVLVTEAPLNPRRNREDAAQLLFEKFKVPALYIASEAPLALYALGRKTGLVLEMGHGVMHTVPVVDGYTIGNAILRLNAAGDDITTYLERLLKERGYSFPTTAEHEIVQDIKEKTGYVAVDYDAEMNKPLNNVEKNYELPDGQKIVIGNERFRCTEILFKPSLLGMDTFGVHQMVAQSVEKCNMTLRNELLSNIVLSGGSSMFPGFPERLLKELQQLVPHNANISIIAHPQRKYAVWHGGSVLASHPDFQSMWVTKQAYDEHGPSILHDKIYQ